MSILESESVSHSVVSDSLQPHGLQPTRLFCPWGFSRQFYWSGLPCPLGDLPNPGLNPGLPHLETLLSEPPGKSKNTSVGSLSLLQGTFPTQELNWASCIADRLPFLKIEVCLIYNIVLVSGVQPNDRKNKFFSLQVIIRYYYDSPLKYRKSFLS